MTRTVTLDGRSLALEEVVAVARDGAEVRVSPEAALRAGKTRAVIERAAAGPDPVYGVNTGFGKLAGVRIPHDRLLELQRNLILSHCAGVGPPLPRAVVRATMLLRANVLLQPTSGARPVLAERLAQLLNAGIHPVVPEQGSVGASGDLAPLSHIARTLLGDGEVDVVKAAADPARRVSASAALAEARIEPVVLQAKEGISFINGTQAQAAMLALLLFDARNLWRSAHGAAAMSLEALRGTPSPFDARIHDVRPHGGQQASAALMRTLLEGSQIRESHRTNDPRVQDAYSLRCIPQVLGAVADGLDFAERILTVELNASTDNPLVFGDELLSGGNFHGQPVAFALDVLTIALTTLVGISERRIEALVNPDLSQGLPAFLTPQAGLQSGYMMVQVMAAALVAECRALATPASVQSIPTDANQEDYVPMGMAGAMKARRVLANAQRVVAAELLCGAQGLEFLKPLAPGRGVAEVYRRVRQVVRPLEADRPLTEDIEELAALLAREAVA
jgi:histidine ammonia-lyase